MMTETAEVEREGARKEGGMCEDTQTPPAKLATYNTIYPTNKLHTPVP